jgi:hypothetical protein
MTAFTPPGDNPTGSWSITGPDQVNNGTPPTFTFGFDSMGRTSSRSGPVPGSSPGQYAGATYGVAGELLTLNGLGYNQTFNYNVSVRASPSFQGAPAFDAVGMWTNNNSDRGGGAAVRKPTGWQRNVKRADSASGNSASSAGCP